MKTKKGFTLIELLIVIAIIGIIAAVIVLNLAKSAKEHARIARLQQFSNSIKGQLSGNPIAWWKFDTKNGINTPDVWGNNDGILQGTADIVSGAGVDRGALDLTDISNPIRNVEINPSSLLPDNFLNSGDWTIEMWVRFEEGGENWQNIFSTFNSGSSITQLRVMVRTWGDILIDACVLPVNSCKVVMRTFQNVVTYDEWHHIVLAYQNIGVDEAKFSFYYDADKIRLSGIENRIIPLPIDKFVIGGVPPSAANNISFDGLIDEVRIYREALTAEEVRRHYVKEIPKYRMTLK